jgi:outer membrane lipoprotein SlyB
MQRIVRLALVLFAALAVASCATTGGGYSGTGVVQSIHESQQASQTGQIIGAIGGAVIGAFAGSAIGSGTGQTIASAAGSVAGGMAGSAVGGSAGTKTVYDVQIQFEDGITRTIRTETLPAFRPGARVQVEGNTITPLR